MATRILINDRVRAALDRLMGAQVCPACGDPLPDHDWLDVQGSGTPAARIVRCDRAGMVPAPRRPADGAVHPL
ncbi:hypothetical protein [Micromonospora aurantiaca (nom. illeg.)]|uniref:hypothetical protein n=1 Tax=Micromonospora aurantiaca (nom. illeg.) TaxID=47850 RepID=UPI0036B5CD38